jgi:uncharacterized protein
VNLPIQHYLWLIPLGYAIGAYGTLIGAGGGFLLVPALLLLYPKESPEFITSVSLAVVFFNAASGSAAYAHMKRIDYRSGSLFAVATIPGAILGAVTTAMIPRRAFDVLFGVLLLAASVFLVRNPEKRARPDEEPSTGTMIRRLMEADGTEHIFRFNPVLGFVLSLGVGYLSSLLGIGGGIIHVPALVHLLSFPVHIATATSHFILAFMAFVGTAAHVKVGAFHHHGLFRTGALAIGVMAGAQLGARLSSRIHGSWIIRCLGIALGLVGIRILLMAA